MIIKLAKAIEEKRLAIGHKVHGKIALTENVTHIALYSALSFGAHELYVQVGGVLVVVIVAQLVFKGGEDA